MKAKIIFKGKDKVVLKFSGEQQLSLRAGLFPSAIQEGEEIKVEFLTEKQFSSRQKNLAQAILEELLKEK